MKIIAFNGPPRSGKDTIANEVSRQLDEQAVYNARVQLSLRMRYVIFELLGLEYSEAKYEFCKDDPQELLDGKSIRQAMIALSEEHIKPTYGQDFWVKSAMDSVYRHKPLTQVALISDLGFQEELDWLDGMHNESEVRVVNMLRWNATWVGDSRKPLTPPGRCITVENFGSADGTAICVAGFILRYFSDWLGL